MPVVCICSTEKRGTYIFLRGKSKKNQYTYKFVNGSVWGCQGNGGPNYCYIILVRIFLNKCNKYLSPLITKVNKTYNRSSGKHTAERLQKLDVKRNVKRAKQIAVKAKRDRIKAKEKRHSVQALKNLKEEQHTSQVF